MGGEGMGKETEITMIIRKVPATLRTELKILAATENRTVQDLIIEALATYTESRRTGKNRQSSRDTNRP